MSVLDPLYRFLSTFDHYGRCQNCRVSWRYKDHMEPAYYTDTEGCFPLCEECARDLSPEEATDEFRRLQLSQGYSYARVRSWAFVWRENFREKYGE